MLKEEKELKSVKRGVGECLKEGWDNGYWQLPRIKK